MFTQYLAVRNPLANPATTHNVVKFIAALSLAHYSPSAISTYVSGIAFHHRIKGWPDPTDAFIVRKLMEGKRRKDGQPDARLPLTLNLLSQALNCLQAVCYSKYEADLFRATFTLAFFGFLRISEYTFDHTAPHKCIKAQNVLITSEGQRRVMKVSIPYSKMDQRGVGQTLLIYPNCENPEFPCPIKTMSNYLLARPAHLRPSDPLLVHFDGSPINRQQVNTMLAKILQVSGIAKQGKWGSHSLRIGAATWYYASKNYSIDKIKEMGRWAPGSNAVLRYIRLQ